MALESDKDYEISSDCDFSDAGSPEPQNGNCSTPLTAPQTPSQSEQKLITCPYEGCLKTFNRKSRLDEHLRSHTNSRPFKCPHGACEKEFLRSSHLQHHLKSAHSNVRNYKCSWEGCDKAFATGTRLRRHEAAHAVREKYTCTGYEGCTKTFRKHDTLRRHITLEHEEKLPFPCPEIDTKTGELCLKAYKTAEKLRTHQRSRHDTSKYSCTECLQGRALNTGDTVTEGDDVSVLYFSTYAELQAHIAEIHPPTCQFCSMSFTTVKEVTRHFEITHNLENTKLTAAGPNLVCPYTGCTRVFTKKGNLTVHVKTVHEKRRDFVCGQTPVALPEEVLNLELFGCGRDFTSKSTLEEHIRTAHLGMGSRRVERERKRKAEKDEEMSWSKVRKPRKPRKDKGVKKVSAVAQLLGADVEERPKAVSNTSTPWNDDPRQFDDDGPMSYDGQAPPYLTGSTTMYGSQLYHTDFGHRSSPDVFPTVASLLRESQEEAVDSDGEGDDTKEGDDDADDAYNDIVAISHSAETPADMDADDFLFDGEDFYQVNLDPQLLPSEPAATRFPSFFRR